MWRFLVTLLVGVAIGWCVAEGFGVEESHREPHASVETELPAASGLAAVPATDNDSPVADETASEASADIPTTAYQAYFDEEFQKAWAELRDDAPDWDAAQERFRSLAKDLPQSIAQRLARQREEAEAEELQQRHVESVLAEGSGTELLDLVKKRAVALDPSLARKVLDRIVTRQSVGPTLQGDNVGDRRKKLDLVDGTTLYFGPGVHALQERLLHANPFPVDVTIQGAGIDSTLLRINDITIPGNVERFALVDLTIDSQDDGLFDLRQGALVLDMENVRVVGFDAGHGGAYVFSARGYVIRARYCQFLGGYGRSPGKGMGSLIRGRPIVARFENCDFSRLGIGVGVAGPALLFSRCRFDEMWSDPRERLQLEDCHVGQIFEIGEGRREDVRRHLSELFPELRR